MSVVLNSALHVDEWESKTIAAVIFNLTLCESDWSASRLRRLYPRLKSLGARFMGDSVASRSGLNFVATRKILKMSVFWIVAPC
jgi:hypothetical protein